MGAVVWGQFIEVRFEVYGDDEAEAGSVDNGV
jgi:hypothetical protein